MSDFKTAYLDSVTLDPYKRVNYTTGLVLGVDEFQQEEIYLLEKQRLHKRALHGYGTICGLHVSSKGPEIRVGPGIAVNPKGQEIRVPQAQCALLNDWLERNKEIVKTTLGSPPQQLQVYLILCYRECKTDTVPIPSGPCMSLEDSSAPSRIADDSELKLVFDPPDQTEDEKVRELIDLLSQIEISDDPGEFLTRKQLEDLVRDLANIASPPMVSPPVTSPPIPMRMRPADAREFTQAAFRVWVTEVRPQLLEAGRNCVAGPPREECVFLAQIEFDVEEIHSILHAGDVTIDEKDRPYLLHTRLLQEYLGSCCTRSPSPSIVTSPQVSSIDESNLMHLTGDEIVAGRKTFTDPLLLNGNSRVEKHIDMPALVGRRISGPASSTFLQGVPIIRFSTGGDATFGLAVPDDIDFTQPVRARLIYSFTIRGAAAGNVNITWQILSIYLAPNEIPPLNPTAFPSVNIANTIRRAQRNRVLVTDFVELPDAINLTDIFGCLRVRLAATTPPNLSLNLFKVEIVYTANKLGRQLS